MSVSVAQPFTTNRRVVLLPLKVMIPPPSRVVFLVMVGNTPPVSGIDAVPQPNVSVPPLPVFLLYFAVNVHQSDLVLPTLLIALSRR